MMTTHQIYTISIPVSVIATSLSPVWLSFSDCLMKVWLAAPSTTTISDMLFRGDPSEEIDAYSILEAKFSKAA